MQRNWKLTALTNQWKIVSKMVVKFIEESVSERNLIWFLKEIFLTKIFPTGRNANSYTFTYLRAEKIGAIASEILLNQITNYI